MGSEPEFALAWLRQRDAGRDAIAAIEDDELRRLDPMTALRYADALLGAVPAGALAADRRGNSGLVVQQALFMRARR